MPGTKQLDQTFVKKFKDYFMVFFKPKMKSILASNLNFVKRGKTPYFVCITKEKIDYREGFKTKKIKIGYDFDKGIVTLNNIDQHSDFMGEFVKKMNQVVDDINHKKTELFREGGE